jgi:hypothetical protein
MRFPGDAPLLFAGFKSRSMRDDTGPGRVTQAEIRASLDRRWQVDSIEPATIEITISPGILAWLACLYARLRALSSLRNR